MSWVSFAVIGWQSSAFTSWNWSLEGIEEILQHVGFHVMAMCCWMCHTGCKWVRKKGSYNVVLFQSRSPRYPSALATAESKTWRYRVSRGIKKPWQINHSQAGNPLPQLTDISFYGRFANKVWSQRQAWDPLGNACGITKEELEAWVRACTQMFPVVDSSNS